MMIRTDRAIGYYKRLEDLVATGVIVDAYGVYDVDEEVLSDFFELFSEYPKRETQVWMESYIQLYSWQFQNSHEGLDGYYDNFYEHTGYEEIQKAGNYLKEIGYKELGEYLIMPSHKVIWEEMSEEEKEDYNQELVKVSDWIYENTEMIFKAYIDILMRNKSSILGTIN